MKDYESSQGGFEYEWNMARYNFERYNFLQQQIDLFITNVRIDPRIDEIKVLYSCLMTLFNNLHAAFIPQVREKIDTNLKKIHAEIIAISQQPRPTLDYKLVYLFDDVHRDLTFAMEQVGLGVPRRKRLGSKEKLSNVV